MEAFEASLPHSRLLTETRAGAPRASDLGLSPLPTPTSTNFLGYYGDLRLADLWRDLVRTEIQALDSVCGGRHSFTTLERRPAGMPLPQGSVEVLQRVLLGECQKSVAVARGLSVSTVAALCSNCLRVMGFGAHVSRAPLVLVLAAHAAAGLPLAAAPVVWRDFRSTTLIIETPMPELGFFLTSSEREAITLLFEGRTYAEIAKRRQRSVRTIANQVSASFRKFGVSGRGELLAHLVRDISGRQRALARANSG